jgi:hypothetical protein
LTTQSNNFDENRDLYANLLGFEVSMDMGWIMTFVSPTNSTAQVIGIQKDLAALAQISKLLQQKHAEGVACSA